MADWNELDNNGKAIIICILIITIFIVLFVSLPFFGSLIIRLIAWSFSLGWNW